MFYSSTYAHVAAFRRLVWKFYREHKRTLPWRDNLDPYAILVSEIMLQQTQVDRVIPKFNAFMAAFPTTYALAAAPLRQVLTAWQGLGYNRRALWLKKTCEAVALEHSGHLPTDVAALTSLPGIGPYTARAVAVFAFNQPHVLIETNIRSVFLHHFFPHAEQVTDEKLLPLIAATLSPKRPREWYWALMDYGSALKKKHPNPSQRSAHYTRQSSFKNSNRQLRGAIMKQLARSPQTMAQLVTDNTFPAERVSQTLDRLVTEGLISKRNKQYYLG